MNRYVKGIAVFCGAVVIALLFRGCAFTSCLIPSEGMENTLYQGERILVNRWSYGLRLPFMSLFSYHRLLPSPVDIADVVVFNNPAAYKEPVIDRRNLFISRCSGLPGDTLWVDSLFYPIKTVNTIPTSKALYRYPNEKENELKQVMHELGIRSSKLMGRDSMNHIRSFSGYEFYLLQQELNDDCWITPLENFEDFHALRPLVIPAAGDTVDVLPWNQALLCNTLLIHEGRQAIIKNDTLYVDGKPTKKCTFTQNYYWMTSDNAINFSDSRLFGLVPENHIIGRASLIWFSKETDTSIKEGYRWNRFFRTIH